MLRHLHITQPALSRQIAQLEEELGKKLYVRDNYGIRLTEDGTLLRKRAQEIIDLEEKTREELMTPDDKNITGTIYIGAGETEGVRYIAGVLRELRGKYPAVTYRMISGEGLKFIPLMPEIKAGLVLAWKKDAVLSKPALKFLSMITALQS